MKISGTVYLFANKYQNKEGQTITRCSINLAETGRDGNTKSRFYLDVRFAGDKAPTKEQVRKMKDDIMYQIDIKDGFLACKSYQKNGETIVKPELVILECEIIDTKKVKKTETEKKKPKPSEPTKRKDDEGIEIEEEELPF